MKRDSIKSQFDALDFPCDEARVRETIAAARRAFIAAESEQTATYRDFLLQQVRFIRKRWWCLQGLLLATICGLLQSSNSAYWVRRCLGATAPLFVILILPELWKNRSASAMEVECTTLYTLRQIYAARLTLFAGVDFALLSLFFAVVSLSAKATLWELLIQFLLPANVACCICFQTLYSRRGLSEAFSIVLCLCWTALWTWIILQDALFDAIAAPVWAALLAASALCVVRCVTSGQRNLQIAWEANAL